MRKLSSIIASLIIAAIFSMAITASAELKTGSVTFDPVASTNQTQIIPLTGEVLQIGIRSSLTNAVNIVLSDFATGSVIYSNSLAATSLNLYPRVAATGTSGAAISTTNGAVYIPVSVAKMRVTVGGSAVTNDSVTVATVVNNLP